MMVHFFAKFSSQSTAGQSGSKPDVESNIEFDIDAVYCWQ